MAKMLMTSGKCLGNILSLEFRGLFWKTPEIYVALNKGIYIYDPVVKMSLHGNNSREECNRLIYRIDRLLRTNKQDDVLIFFDKYLLFNPRNAGTRYIVRNVILPKEI